MQLLCTSEGNRNLLLDHILLICTMRKIYHAFFLACFLTCSSGYQVGRKPQLTWGRPPDADNQSDGRPSPPSQNAIDGSEAESSLDESSNSDLEIDSIRRGMGRYMHVLGPRSSSSERHVLQSLPLLGRTTDERNVGSFMHLLDRNFGVKKRNVGRFMYLLNSGKRNVGRYMHLLNKKSDNRILPMYSPNQHAKVNNRQGFDQSSGSEHHENVRGVPDDPYKRNYNMLLYYNPPKGMVVDYIGSGIFRRQLENLGPLMESHLQRDVTPQLPGQGLLDEETKARRDRKTLAQVLRQINNGGRSLDLSQKQARVALKQLRPPLGNLNSLNPHLPGTRMPLVQRLQGLRQGKLYNQALKAKILKTYRKF